MHASRSAAGYGPRGGANKKRTIGISRSSAELRNAAEWTRTTTTLRPLAPEASASANSATAACSPARGVAKPTIPRHDRRSCREIKVLVGRGVLGGAWQIWRPGMSLRPPLAGRGRNDARYSCAVPAEGVNADHVSRIAESAAISTAAGEWAQSRRHRAGRCGQEAVH